jgi:hypothetical protein
MWAAAGGVKGDTGVAVLQRGCVVSRTGPGVYSVVLDRHIGASKSVILITPRQQNPVRWKAAHTTPGTKTLTFYDVATGAIVQDTTFDVVILEVP